MERTAATLVLLLAVTATAVGAPQLLLGRLRGNHAGHRTSLLGSIINSTAGILMKPLSILGVGDHSTGSGVPDSGHSGVPEPPGQPSSGSSTNKPTSEGVPHSGGYGDVGGINSVNTGGVHGEDNSANNLNSGNSGQTSGTTPNSIDAAIQDIFGNGGGVGTTSGQVQANTPSMTGGPGTDDVLAGPTTAGSRPQENTPSDVDLAFQQIFGGGGHKGYPVKDTSTETPGSSEPHTPASSEKEIGSQTSSKPYKEEEKQSTMSPVDSAILDVFGTGSKETDVSSSKPVTNKGNESFSTDSTPSSVDLAIMDVFGKKTR